MNCRCGNVFYALLEANLPRPVMKSPASRASASRPSKSVNSPLERLERTGARALFFLFRVDEIIILALRAVRVRSSPHVKAQRAAR
jgi:hypothetical protein